MWDIPVITDRTIPANRADVALHDKKENTCLLIDIATPDDSNFNTKETEEPSKYKDLETEVSRRREVRTEIVPVITGVIGTMKK
jgi:glutamyl-tRNA reductase